LEIQGRDMQTFLPATVLSKLNAA